MPNSSSSINGYRSDDNHLENRNNKNVIPMSISEKAKDKLT